MNVLPGTSHWHGSMISMLQHADWEDWAGAGVIEFDDGTIWTWTTEAIHRVIYGVGWGLRIMEMSPGQGWEVLTADNWEDWEEYTGWPSSGKMINDSFVYSQNWYLVPVGDKVFAFPQTGFHGQDYLVVFDKTDRTYVTYDNTTEQIFAQDPLASVPMLANKHIWWIQQKSGQLPEIRRLATDNPTSSTQMYEFTQSGTPVVTDPSTGVPYGLGETVLQNNAVTMTIDGDYVYILEGFQGIWSGAAGNVFSAIRRMRLGDRNGKMELLYYHLNPVHCSFYNYSDTTVDHFNGPFPKWVGMVPMDGTMTSIRDDWLYWWDQASYAHYQRNIWSGGYTMNRIYLPDLLDNAPVKHNPASPSFEIILGGTGPYDSWGKWQESYPYKVLYREGSNPLVSYPEASSWVMDSSGSVLYVHKERLPYFYPDSLPTFVLSRLSKGIETKVTLSFEGNQLKGYGSARDIPMMEHEDIVELT